MDMFLHGFATTPEIWPAGGPHLAFDDLEREAGQVASGIGRERVRLIGWSMGGMVALIVAARYPAKVERLVLVSTTPKFIAADGFSHGLPLALLRRLEKRIRTEGIKAFHSLVFPDGHPAGLANLTVEQALKELAALEKVDLRPLLPLIKVPTLIIHGDRDEICLPGAAEYLQKNIAGSKLIMLPGVKHAPLAELEKYVGQNSGQR